MKQTQTHYDKLKVARDAPNEVIRAAYKSLSQKYHPDRNQGDLEAARIMSEINVAYDVLSDPERRKFYDMELRQQELVNQAVQQNETKPTGQYAQTPYRREPENYQQPYQREYDQRPPIESIASTLFGALLRNRIFFIILLLCLWSWFGSKSSLLPTSSAPKTQQSSAFNSAPVYVKPATAPNGNRWPDEAGYIAGYDQLRADGYSTVTVDNSQNDSDVYVNLMHLKIGRSQTIRYFYIPAYSKFTVTKIAAGIYGIRYQDLNSGEFSSSKPFMLQETTTENGVKNSNVTITIYKVARDKKNSL